MSGKELSKDQQTQIAQLERIIKGIREKGAFDAAYFTGICGAQTDETVRLQVFLAVEGDTHAANFLRLSVELVQEGMQMQAFAVNRTTQKKVHDNGEKK